MHATAIITDENDVGTFIDKAANLKAIITGDAILINRKFKLPITYSFRGFMIQCLNEMPKIRDKSDSFFRRQKGPAANNTGYGPLIVPLIPSTIQSI